MGFQVHSGNIDPERVLRKYLRKSRIRSAELANEGLKQG